MGADVVHTLHAADTHETIEAAFQTLLDDTRRELAEQYLAQPGMTLLETAYLLGFADPSNFYRAFRRWFDATPSEYRARLGAEGEVLSDARTPACTTPTP